MSLTLDWNSGLIYAVLKCVFNLYRVQQKNLTVFNITGLKNHQVFLLHPVLIGVSCGHIHETEMENTGR